MQKNKIQLFLDFLNRTVDFGIAYYDDQEVNLKDYEKIINYLSKYFGMSEAMIEIRLKELSLLDDRRSKKESEWDTLVGLKIKF